MGESLLLITIISLVVLTIRRARPVVLESPVIIQRPGQYHITLAPQLNRAQTFVEQIAAQYLKSPALHGDFPDRYFEVRDPKVFAKGSNSYLLAVSLRDGLLYFQAANPGKQDDQDQHLKTIREFSEGVLKQHGHGAATEAQALTELDAAVEEVARQLQIEVKALAPKGG